MRKIRPSKTQNRNSARHRRVGRQRSGSDGPNQQRDHGSAYARLRRGCYSDKSIRSQLAVFLHDKHSRTADPLGKAREMPEPDSLGG